MNYAFEITLNSIHSLLFDIRNNYREYVNTHDDDDDEKYEITDTDKARQKTLDDFNRVIRAHEMKQPIASEKTLLTFLDILVEIDIITDDPIVFTAKDIENITRRKNSIKTLVKLLSLYKSYIVDEI